MENLTPEQIAWLRLSLTDGIGPLTFWRLINQYQNAEEACQLYSHTAQKKATAPLASLATTHQVIRTMEKCQGSLVFFSDDTYPPLLRTLSDPPPILYCLGKAALLTSPSLAIVGGRNASLGGQTFAKTFASTLSNQGICIVSGLARGIDQAAHHGALSQVGSSIGVLAGGVDVIYPQENKALYLKMRETGLLISEMPPQTAPTAKLFPKRNRIISGLSKGVVVIEASLKSGSLITARCALEQNREVMAVPGFPSDPRHHGSNHLIRQGAALVESADDVMAHMSTLMSTKIQPHRELPPRETIHLIPNQNTLDSQEDSLSQQLLSLLGPTPIGLDEIITQTGFSCPQITSALSELEVTGQVMRGPGGSVTRVL
jgi:DNA processing protein